MSYTDADLKQLKESIKAMIGQPGRVGILPDKAFALVARLEAAELCAESCYNDERCVWAPYQGVENPYESWRTTAGKEKT